MRSIFFAAMWRCISSRLYCGLRILPFCGRTHPSNYLWSCLDHLGRSLCHPSIGATLQAQRLEMHLEWFETEAWNNDVLAVVKIIYSDITEKRQIQSTDLSCIGSLCSIKDWKRGGCINRGLELCNATVDGCRLGRIWPSVRVCVSDAR